MKILIVGSGGREHAIIKTLIRQGVNSSEIFCAPGNGGISKDVNTVNISPTSINELTLWAEQNKIDLTIASMDDSLAAGIVDSFNNKNLRIFGPTKNQAMLESSKIFAKNFMEKYNIPTGKYLKFSDYNKALDFVEKNNKYPIVIKADGLALGKGVIIPNNFEEAKKALNNIMVEKVFGDSGNNVVIEEFLVGSEISVLAFADGKKIEIMPACKDHKKIFDGEKGPNTGGMGTFCPAISYSSELGIAIKNEIFKPTEQGLKDLNYKGIIFFGIILTENGPKVLEYNARFGDPEAQVVLPLLKTSLLTVFNQCIDGNLQKVEWDNKNSSICVMLASKGYPGAYEKNKLITGLSSLNDDVIVYHSGTSIKNHEFFTSGGRVLGLCSVKSTLEEASKNTYNEIRKVHFDGMQYRTDISV